MESTASGGSTNDYYPTEVNPFADFLSVAGVCLQRNGVAESDSVRFYRSSDNQWTFVDQVNGTVTLSQIVAAGAGGAISALTGDVTASGSGSVAATVAKVGGQLAADIATVTALIKGNQTAAYFLAAPNGSNGAFAARSILATDLPSIPATQITGLAASATSDTTNAANIVSGTLPSARLAGAYGGITGVGTLASGSVPITLLGISGASTGYVPTYNGTTVVWAAQTGSANDASTLTTGTLPAGRLQGAYTGITQVGTLSSLATTGDINTSGGRYISGYAGSSQYPNFGDASSLDGMYCGSNSVILMANGTPVLNASPSSVVMPLVSQFNQGIVFAGSTSGTLSIKVPATVSTYTLTMPSAVGALGQTLITDASGNLSWGTPGGSGTVTSVALSVPSGLFVAGGSPVTGSGTLAVILVSQSPNQVWAGPSGGTSNASPTFRSLVAADIPTLPYSQISGLAASATSDTTNAANIVSGTLPSARLAGAYGGITIAATQVTGLAASATTDTTNAANITSGALALARLSITGATSGQALTFNGTAAAWSSLAYPAISAAAINTSYPLALVTGSNTLGSGSTTNQTAIYTGFGITLTDKPTTNTRNPTFYQAIWWNGGTAEAGSIQMTAYAVGGTGGAANENIDLNLYRNETPTGGSPAVSAALVFPGSQSSVYGNVGGGAYLKSGTPYSAGSGGIYTKGSAVVLLGTSALSATTAAGLNGSALSVLGTTTCVAKSYINGATSGYVALAVNAAPTSYTLTLPNAVATVSGQALTSDTSGNLSWTTITETGVSINTPSTLVQRDAYGAVNLSRPVQVFTGAAQTHTLAGSESFTQFQLQGSGTSYGLNLTLAANPASQGYEVLALHAAIAGATYTVTPVSSGSILYPQGSTTGTLVSTTPQSALTLTGAPNTSNYVVSALTGVWRDSANSNVLIGTLSADAGATGVATTANTAYAVMLRDSAGGFVAGAGSMSSVLVRGSASGAVTISGPSAGVVTSYPVRMPAAQGAANTVPVNDGSGNLSWATPTTATSGFPASVTVVNQLTAYTFTSADRGKLFTNNNATAITVYTLPSAPAIGDTYWAAAQNQTNYIKVQQGNASHLIYLPAAVTTAGTTHGIAYTSNARGGPGVIALTYVAANTWCWSAGYPFDWAAY